MRLRIGGAVSADAGVVERAVAAAVGGGGGEVCGAGWDRGGRAGDRYLGVDGSAGLEELARAEELEASKDPAAGGWAAVGAGA